MANAPGGRWPDTRGVAIQSIRSRAQTGFNRKVIETTAKQGRSLQFIASDSFRRTINFSPFSYTHHAPESVAPMDSAGGNRSDMDAAASQLARYG